MTEKVRIRKLIKSKLNDLGGTLRNEYSDEIKLNLISLPEYINSKTLFVYISFANEVHTKDIIDDAFKNEKRVFVPNIEGNNMSMIEIRRDTTYTANNYGIIEPVFNKEDIYNGDIDIAIIPLIGYDRKFGRLGRGGGYYDKFLQDRKCKKIAIAYSIQEVDKLPIESHDVKMDIIVTEEGIIRYESN